MRATSMHAFCEKRSKNIWSSMIFISATCSWRCGMPDIRSIERPACFKSQMAAENKWQFALSSPIHRRRQVPRSRSSPHIDTRHSRAPSAVVCDIRANDQRFDGWVTWK
jgi:hypothetical protein